MKTEREVLTKARDLMIKSEKIIESYISGELCGDGPDEPVPDSEIDWEPCGDDAGKLRADLEDTIREADIILDNLNG